MISSGSLEEILAISRTAVEIFASLGLKCCLTGGVASTLYGTTRCPNDTDIVVLTSMYGQEALKRLLTERDSRFYTVAAKSPLASYRVLWYRLGLGRQCKVDILTPGVMNIPDVPSRHIVTIRSIPVMPFIPQLLLKLQAWSDHRVAVREYMRVKQHVDVTDITQLFTIARRRGETIGRSSSAWIPKDFIDAAQRRVHEYISSFPQSASSWKALGFEVKRVQIVNASHQRRMTLRYHDA